MKFIENEKFIYIVDYENEKETCNCKLLYIMTILLLILIDV